MSGRILVVGGYGYGNVGDEAMLAGLLTRLDRRAVTVVSRDPRRSSELHGVRAVAVQQAPLALASHDTLIIGGGSLFGRDMGRIGRLLPAFGLVAHALGRRVELVGIGLDDVAPSGGSVRRLLERAARVVVRDRPSLELARRWGVHAALEPDLSAAMPDPDPATGETLLRAAGLDPRRPVVGLCLTGVDAQLAQEVLPAVAEAIRRLPEAQFAFIPMARHPNVAAHDDAVLGGRLRDAEPAVRILEAADDPRAVLGAFGWLDAAVCMRFHSLVFAERAGVPIVPIAYASKCATWIGERGLSSVAVSADAIAGALDTALRRAQPLERRAG